MLKKIFTAFICISLILSLAACGSAPTEQEENTAISTSTPANTSDTKKSASPTPTVTSLHVQSKLGSWDGKKIKLLAIGNSYSMNALSYFYEICKAEGAEEVILGNLVIGGCSVATHLSNAMTGANAYTYRKCKRTNSNSKFSDWKVSENISMLDMLNDEEWDIITFQQYSAHAGLSETYDDLQKLMTIVKGANKKSDTVYAWHMTWAYQKGYQDNSFSPYAFTQSKMYNDICDAVQAKIVPNNEISVIIPSGTAIQNARAALGDVLSTDGSHLNELGQYILGYTWYAALTGKTLTELKYAITSIKHDEATKKTVLNAVNDAVTNSFAVTEK